MSTGVLPVMAQDVSISGDPVTLNVMTKAEGSDSAEDAQDDESAEDGNTAGSAEKTVDHFRIFGQTQDGMMLIRTDSGDEYVSKDELTMLLPELELDAFPVVEEIQTAETGSRGENVETLQQVLAELGYLDGDVDGAYGSGTAEAVSKFQEDQGLDATGAADVYTMMLITAIHDGIEENVEVSSGGYKTPEEKFPGIVDNTDVDLAAFMEPTWRFRFDEETQTGVIDPGIELGSFAVETPAIDKISGDVSIMIRVSRDEATDTFVLIPVVAVETAGASRPYMQGAVLEGSRAAHLSVAESTGELNGITMSETSYIVLTESALNMFQNGDAEKIQLQGKNNKTYEVTLEAGKEELAVYAETCVGLEIN